LIPAKLSDGKPRDYRVAADFVPSVIDLHERVQLHGWTERGSTALRASDKPPSTNNATSWLHWTC
jgi:hypothetical protein